jgi:hypothetical protein
VLDFEAARNALKSIPEVNCPEETDNTVKAVWFVETPEGPMPNVVYGEISLNKKQLTLECKSQKRLKLGKGMLAKFLGESVRHKADKIQEAGQFLKDGLSKSPKPSKKSEIPQEVKNQLMKQFMEEHYRKWLDEKNPALDGKTPREAAKNPKSREKLVWLLKDIEYGEEQKKQAGEFGYDINKIRQELGLK